MPDYYQLLNLAPSATPEQITGAYHRRRAALLAAAGADETRVALDLQTLEEAYAVLSDPPQRAAYDRTRSPGQATAMTVANAPSMMPYTPPMGPGAQLNPPAAARPVEQRACPHCGVLNPAQATTCANCGQQITRACPKCGNPVVDGERVCSRCGTVLAEYDQNRYMQAKARENQIQTERTASGIRVGALEQTHRTNRVYGVIFWVVVVALIIGVLVLGVILLGSRAS